MNYLDDIHKHEKAYSDFSQKIKDNMKNILNELVKLVDTGEINSFSFESNKNDIELGNPIYVNIKFKKYNSEIASEIPLKLGFEEDIKSNHILLNDINKYLLTLNKYFVHDLEPILDSTYYEKEYFNPKRVPKFPSPYLPKGNV